MASQTRTWADKRGLAGWTTHDLLVTLGFALAFTLISVPMGYLWVTLNALFGPLAGELITGVFYVPYLVVPYSIRRPGAAGLSAVLGSLVALPFSSFGWIGFVLNGVLTGILVEIPYAVTRYRAWSSPALIGIGLTIALLTFGLDASAMGYVNLSGELLLPTVSVRLLGAALAAWLSKLLADGLVRTGVLRGSAASRQQAQV